MQYLYQFWDYILLLVGLGVVVFVHELGHFIAAKYCGVKVEQFAVGFGPAVFAWRKGMGFRWGSTEDELAKEAAKRNPAGNGATDAVDANAPISEPAGLPAVHGVGETEYRLNWIPLGGYVKMLGQDDLRPGGVAGDPRAFNNKPISSRMAIVSAGVIMNVILAAVAFAIVFRIGYPVPPAIVGALSSESPALQAVGPDGKRVGLQPGDQIITYNGHDTLGDFSEILLNSALTRPGATVPLMVRDLDGKEETLRVKPDFQGGDSSGILALGFGEPDELKGVESVPEDPWDAKQIAQLLPPDAMDVQPGDVITQINGQDVQPNESWKLLDALSASEGKPVELTVKAADGTIRHPTVTPHLADSFGKDPLNFLGMEPRAAIAGILPGSPTIDKLKPGDVIGALSGAGGDDQVSNPSKDRVHDLTLDAGDKKKPVTFTVLSLGDAAPHAVEPITPTMRLGDGHIGLGVALRNDEQHLVVAETIPGSSAANKIPDGATITEIDGQAVQNWFQVGHIIAAAKPGAVLAIEFTPVGADATPATTDVTASAGDIETAQMMAVTDDLQLHQMTSTLKTSNPLVAVKWGVVKTRNLILQFYVTLRRMVTGGVSLRNVMGPVGLVHAGAQIASRGWVWLLWFLANISANLAVVNFLPFPIVDGGLFTLLVLEKIQGKPLPVEVQKVVQIVGLALILCIFLLVTYQDIARMAGF